MSYEYIVIGAGLSGAVIAERIASGLGMKVMVIEKRDHIGGNCYDEHDSHGVLVHRYGPHAFHTDSKVVWLYLSSFTRWRRFHLSVMVDIDGLKIPLPFNFVGIAGLFDRDKARRYMDALTQTFGVDRRVPVLELRNCAGGRFNQLADFILDKIYINYSKKQWGIPFHHLDRAVTSRVPIVTGTSDLYFQDRYQGIPENGYTAMIQEMLEHPKITVRLNTDYRDILSFDHESGAIELCGSAFHGTLINTGKIDEFLGYRFGELPYRSLRFKFGTFESDRYQECAVINYPNEFEFTRITEFKHMTGQDIDCTTITWEYPGDHIRGGNEPYYPVPMASSAGLYDKYTGVLKGFDNVVMLGRLGEYRYYDMDKAVSRSLEVFEEIRSRCKRK